MDPDFTKLQQQGQELYKQKNYEGALKCFNSVISQCVDPPISLLDNRAATSSKLGDYQRALSDGKRMISLGKSQVTGYLRTGQILQLMQKNDMALGIYSYGMKNVPVGNEDFKLLRGMYDKLATKCSPPKAVDPLMVLPTELVELVFQYLNLQNLVNLLRVSKQWKSLLESMPKLWRNLDLSTAKRTVSFQAIKACVLRSRGSATHATVGKWLRNGKTKESLIYITSRCRGLEYLKIQGIGFNEFLFKGVTMPNSLKSLILSPHVEVSLGYVCKSLNSLHCLARAEFHQILAEGSAQWTRDLSQLRILVLNAARPFDTPRDIRLADLFPRIPHIQELSIRAWKGQAPRSRFAATEFSSLIELRILHLDHFHLTAFPCLPPTIQSLSLERVDGIKSRSDDIISYPVLPALTSLTLSACGMSDLDIVALLNGNESKLRKFHISNSGGFLFEKASYFVDGSMSELTDLRLTFEGVTDKLAVIIAKHCPKLQTFDASYNTKLTGVGVKALVLKEGPLLRSLDLTHCSGVSADAVTWARDKGVEVRFIFPDKIKFTSRVNLG